MLITADPIPPMVSFSRVSKNYGALRLALNEASFTIARGEFVLLTGASGAGKSTVLRLITALEAPTSGSIVVAGQEVSALKAKALPYLRRSIGVVTQDLMLLHDRSLLANVALPALASGVPLAEARTRARAALERVGLGHESDALLPAALSGGGQQRAALARAIVNRPALVLADEPTAHLDPAAAADILRLLEQFSVGGVTVMIASHGEAALVPSKARVLRVEAGKVLE